MLVYYLLIADLLQIQRLGGHLLRVSIHAGTEQHLPRQRGLRIATLADAGQTQLRVLLDRHKDVAGVETARVDEEIWRFGTVYIQWIESN